MKAIPPGCHGYPASGIYKDPDYAFFSYKYLS